MTTTIEKVRLRRNTATRPIAHPETELAQISDMSSFVRGVCESTDAASFRAAIAATAENCGGIVAQSLTTNGYVKFANGLILQWTTNTAPTLTGNDTDVIKNGGPYSFPIDMDTLLATVHNTDTNWSSSIAYVELLNVTTSTFKVKLRNAFHVHFIFIGI